MLDAFHLSATGTRRELRRALGGLRPPEATLLRAVAAQYGGDVDGAVRIMKRLVSTLRGPARAAVADVLAPLLVMRHENAEVIALAGVMQLEGWHASAHAFLALAYADLGTRDAAKRHAAASRAALMDETSEIIRGRVLQRLSRAAYYLNEHERALDLALASANVNAAIGAWRIAAGGYSVAYSVHHNVTGNVYEAARYVRLWYEAASRSEDESIMQQARVADFALCVQFADEARIEQLDREIKRKHLPQQFAELYPLALSNALLQGRSDLAKMHTLLSVLRDFSGRSRGEWALCTALMAVCEAAEADRESATRHNAEAIARLGRARSRDPAYEQRNRRMARIAVAISRTLLGDDAVATRTMEAKESLQGKGEELLPELMRSERLEEASPAFRGFALVFATAWARRTSLFPPAGLTSAEFEVLRLYGRGWSAVRIARETQRSVKTIYNQTHFVLEKLGASRAPEAVAIARGRGLLP